MEENTVKSWIVSKSCSYAFKALMCEFILTPRNSFAIPTSFPCTILGVPHEVSEYPSSSINFSSSSRSCFNACRKIVTSGYSTARYAPFTQILLAWNDMASSHLTDDCLCFELHQSVENSKGSPMKQSNQSVQFLVFSDA